MWERVGPGCWVFKDGANKYCISKGMGVGFMADRPRYAVARGSVANGDYFASAPTLATAKRAALEDMKRAKP
jgi:hypothetical protein